MTVEVIAGSGPGMELRELPMDQETPATMEQSEPRDDEPRDRRRTAEVDWEEIQEVYESGWGTQDAICERFGITTTQLNLRIKKYVWKRRKVIVAVDRPQIIIRMFRVLELQVLSLEEDMDEMRRAKGRSGEREVAVLGRLATNLEKLMALEGAAAKPGARGRSRSMETLRSKLIERIEHLKRQ